MLLQPDVPTAWRMRYSAYRRIGIDCNRASAATTTIANIAGVLARALSRSRRRLVLRIASEYPRRHLLRNYAMGIGGDNRTICGCGEAGLTNVGATAGHPRACGALQFIQQNYAHELTLSNIAAAVSLSPFHLTRLFKRTLGISLYQHVLQVRVNSARSLLAAGTSGRSLAEIAAAVGFADQSHLTRHFKRITGVTPRQFRMTSAAAKAA
jgi:AraC-like DNA-binding protein